MEKSWNGINSNPEAMPSAGAYLFLSKLFIHKIRLR